MSHLSIAIIKAENSVVPEERSFEYLVIKHSKNEFKFFDYENPAHIGGSFDYSFFKSQVMDHFNLKRNDDYDDQISNFLPFKSHRDYSAATAYQYFLTFEESRRLKKYIKSVSDHDISYLWKTEQELIKLKSKWKKEQCFIFDREAPFKEPQFSNHFRSSIRNIVRAKNNGKLVVFAGAGVSVDSDVPNWVELVEQLRTELDNDKREFNLVGDQFLLERGQKEYHEKIQEILNHGHTKANPIHEQILKLKPLHVVTTNYDTHFEQLIDTGRFQYSVVSQDSDLPYTKSSSLLIKMHGDFDSRNIIFTQDDYDNYSTLFPLVEGYVKGLFASKLVLFIGFSFTDPNLDQILKSVTEILKEDTQRPYLLFIPTTEPDAKSRRKSKSNIKRLREAGLTILEYDNDSISLYFEQICSERDRVSLKELSERGIKTFQFLKVLKVFDLFSDTLENSSVDQQFINSINRFGELGAIPRKVIESISPFRIKKYSRNQPSTNASFRYGSNFELETLNEGLLSFLKKLSNDSGEIKFERNKVKRNGKNDINSALELLYDSGVFSIVRKDDTSPFRVKLKPSESNSVCTCNRCLYDDFKFRSLFAANNRSFSKLSKTETHSSLDLCDIYGFFKMGEIVKANDALIELQRQSWQNRQYITFFLASYNLVKLKSFAWLSLNSPFKEPELYEIRLNIDSIDLDKILCELPIDAATYHALKYIKDNRIMVESEYKLEKAYKEITDHYKAYQRAGYESSGPSYWYDSEASFYNLWNFYHKNYLFDDQFWEFSNVSHLYLESMIASYQTSSRSKQRLTSFSSIFAYALLHYADPKRLNSTIIEYGLKQFSFERPKILEDVFETFDNFVKSAYEERNVLGYRVYPHNNYISILQGNSRVADKIRSIFNNYMLLFAHSELSIEQFESVLKKTLNFLGSCPIFYGRKGHKYFSIFIEKHCKKLTTDDLRSVFLYALGENFWSDNLTYNLSSSILKNTTARGFLGEDYLEKLKWRLRKRDSWGVRLTSFIEVFELLQEDLRPRFFEMIKPTFENCDNIKKSYYAGIWNPNSHFELLTSFINTNFNAFSNFPDYKVASNGYPEDANNYGPWNDLYFVVRLIYEYDLFNDALVNSVYEAVDSMMFKWVMRPDEFDYSKFKAKWVVTFSIDPILLKLSTNQVLKDAIMKELSEEYNEHVAEVFYKKLNNQVWIKSQLK